MSEKTAYKWLKAAIIRPGDRIDRLENLVGTGMPDTNLCIDGAESWIEIKEPKEPKRAKTSLFGSNHKLSQDQKNWILRQLKAGGRAYIFIVTDKRRLLIDGRHADALNEMTVEEICSHSSWHCHLACSANEKESLRGRLLL